MMVKRNLVIFIVPTFFFSTISAYLYFENVANHNLLIEYKANTQRLLSQVKGIGEEKVAQEKELASLRDEISRLNVLLAAGPQSNMVIEENALSDYREAEDEMSKRIIYEYELSRTNKNSDRRLDLIKEISSLEPSSVSEIMSLQRQFGRFIQALSVNEERMEEIVGVLTNYVAGQSQARQTILEQAKSDQIDRREIGNLMRAVMNRELMYEELSYYLNQDEISLLQQAHKEQTDEEAFYDRGRPSGGFRGSQQ